MPGLLATALPLLLLVPAAGGCGGGGPRPGSRAKGEAAKQAERAAAAAAAAAEVAAEAETYVYSPVGKRDPFKSFFEAAKVDHIVTPTTRFQLEQYKLVAIITGIAEPRAMVEDPEGKGLFLQKGTPLGKNGGKVSAVKRDGVVVTEIVTLPDGRKQAKTHYVKLPVMKEEDLARR